MVRQSFDIFHVYGKDADALENILAGFITGLEEYDAIDIQAAFKEWLKEKSAFPTPADIRQLAAANKKFREVRAGRSSAVSQGPARMVPRTPSTNLDPWVMKQYPDAMNDGSVLLFFNKFRAEPKAEEKERGFEWLRYATFHLGYPKSILADFRQYVGLNHDA